jgi:hypothetical protein
MQCKLSVPGTLGMSVLQPLLYCRGRSQLIKIFMGRWRWILSYWEKKTNQIDQKLREWWAFLQTVLIKADCINGLKFKHSILIVGMLETGHFLYPYPYPVTKTGSGSLSFCASHRKRCCLIFRYNLNAFNGAGLVTKASLGHFWRLNRTGTAATSSEPSNCQTL